MFTVALAAAFTPQWLRCEGHGAPGRLGYFNDRGETGDGLIFVYPIQEVVRIRTGERGQEALTYQGDIDDRKRTAAPVVKNAGNGKKK